MVKLMSCELNEDLCVNSTKKESLEELCVSLENGEFAEGAEGAGGGLVDWNEVEGDVLVVNEEFEGGLVVWNWEFGELVIEEFEISGGAGEAVKEGVDTDGLEVEGVAEEGGVVALERLVVPDEGWLHDSREGVNEGNDLGATDPAVCEEANGVRIEEGAVSVEGIEDGCGREAWKKEEAVLAGCVVDGLDVLKCLDAEVVNCVLHGL